MIRPSICISFDYEEDKNYRKTFNLWKENPNIDFNFNDKTPTEIDSYDISSIKRGLSRKINEAEIVLVISGQYINKRHRDSSDIESINWQNWECKKAIELGKSIILLKLDSNCAIPDELYGHTDRVDITGLTLENVKEAIRKIRR